MIHKHGKNNAPHNTVVIALLELPAVTSDLTNENQFFIFARFPMRRFESYTAVLNCDKNRKKLIILSMVNS